MITPQQLADAYALNVRIAHMQTEGLSHTDSLVQAPYNINNLNWVLGHMIVHRDKVLKLLDQAPLLDETQTALYDRESQPVSADTPDLLTLERLLKILDQGQEIINERLPALSDGELAEELRSGERTFTRAARLHWYYFHDTYHTGQTELLRQVAGMEDKII
jgi:uncharacterized damage-inducible protein DinB